MIIATFGPTTGWAGKTITREGDVFTLEDHGPITAVDVMEYDRQGHLVWANDGTRSRVVAAATSPNASLAATASTTSATDKPAGAGALVGAASRPAVVKTVDVKRVSRGDWVVGGGLLVMLLGTSLPWSTFAADAGLLKIGFNNTGWHSALGVLSLLAGLAAAVVVILASGVLPQLHIDFRGRVSLVVIGLGGLALIFVLLGLVAGPGDIYNGFGVGILLSLLGAATVAVGGVLKLREPTSDAATLKASAAVDNAMKSAKAALMAVRVPVAAQKGAQKDSQSPAQAQTTVVEPLREAPVSAKASTAGSPGSVADEIAKLADLHARGSLTKEEFAAFKAKLMG